MIIFLIVSVYDIAEEEYSRHYDNSKKKNPKKAIFDKIRISPSTHARWEKHTQSKLSVELDVDSLMKNEVDRIKQFQDTVSLLDKNGHTQGLAHQINLCFKSYVKEDIKGYINHFGMNEYIQGRVKVMLKVFSEHMMTILSKLVEGMSTNYLSHLSKNQNNDGTVQGGFRKDEDKDKNKENNKEGFLNLAEQWSNQNHMSPRTMEMSMSSIQSAISREIMCAPFDLTTKEIKVPTEMKKSKYFSVPMKQEDNTSYDECPETEKVYDRLKSLKNAALTKIAQLNLNDTSNVNTSTSRKKTKKPNERLAKKLPKNTIKVLNKEISLDRLSPSQDTYPTNMSAVGRCISNKNLTNYTILRNSSREDVNTPILSLKTSTINTPSHDISQHTILDPRLTSNTPTLQGPKLNPSLITKKRSGSGEKNSQRILKKFVISKGIGKGKGRNKNLRISSTTNLHKNSTIELRKIHLLKQVNLRNSPKLL